MARDADARLRLTLVARKESGLKYLSILGKNRKHGRSSMKLKESRDALTIEISAKDATALRAQANSILRDLQVIEQTDMADE